MSKQKFGTIIGFIALIAFFIIAYLPKEIKTFPINIIGIICFFTFLTVGISSLILPDYPNAMQSINKKNKK